MSAEDMHEAPRCQHVRLSGRRCKAPAKRGNNYCLFHEAEHETSTKLTFPPVEDAASVQVATDQVLQALRDDNIEFPRASLMFSGLRIARANLKQLGIEMGEETPGSGLRAPDDKVRVGHTKEELLDERMSEMPSLAEILLERLSERMGAPIDIAEAKASGKDLGKLLVEKLHIQEPCTDPRRVAETKPGPGGAVPTGLDDETGVA